MLSLNKNESTQQFLAFLEEWFASLPALSLQQEGWDAQKTALISVDLICGFCDEGLLSSPRVAAIVAPAVTLMQLLWENGVRDFVLTQDNHPPDAEEFSEFGPHCVRGTREAETVDEIKQLSFHDSMTVILKNSIQSGMNTELHQWLERHSQIDTFVVVGDCTDLCVYQLAMDLKLQANARQQKRRVVVPANCVDTYDLSVESAKELGIMPHPGDLLHLFFLYHMALNGIEVVKEIQP
ncbi:MAG TPA: cysteine hydrolase [Chloroflexi bacterium]|nr:cysteine hydrolase [Chloroflexota bacterium]